MSRCGLPNRDIPIRSCLRLAAVHFRSMFDALVPPHFLLPVVTDSLLSSVFLERSMITQHQRESDRERRPAA
jgi:hypothetical protein